MSKINMRNVKLIVILLITSITIVSATVFAIYQTRSNAPIGASDAHSETKSSFSFTGATDWRQGPSNETSMALFSKARGDGTSACFTSIELKSGTVNVIAELQKQQIEYKASGRTMTETAIVNNTLQTMDGDKQYELRQYEIDGGSKNTQAMGGLELGYLQLENKYVKVAANCEIADALPTTITALQAYTLNR